MASCTVSVDGLFSLAEQTNVRVSWPQEWECDGSAAGGNGKEEVMGRSRMTRVLAATLVVALVCGCATFGKGPSDEELIMQTLNGYTAGLVDQDIDKLMAAYSDDFEGEGGATKEDLREFLGGAIDQGYLEDVEADLEDCKIEIEGGKAKVGPVGYSAAMGSITAEYTMKKDPDGVWRIVESFMY